MMKLMDKFKNQSGIFEIFYNNFQELYTSLLSNTNYIDLDNNVLFKYSNKTLIDAFKIFDNETIIKTVINIYKDKWLDNYSIITNVNTNGNTEVTTKTGTLQKASINSQIINNFEKAFNDSEFISDTKEQNDNNNNQTDTYNITETKTNNVINNIKEKNEFIKENNIKDIVINDIINYICIDIY